MEKQKHTIEQLLYFAYPYLAMAYSEKSVIIHFSSSENNQMVIDDIKSSAGSNVLVYEEGENVIIESL